MNHPTSEDWVQFLYKEQTPEKHHEMEQHLATCQKCHEQVLAMKTTMAQLDEWKIPQRKRVTLNFVLIFKWAAAACLILLLGFAAGRVSAKPDMAQIRAAIEPELKRELKQELAQMIQTEVVRASENVLTTASDHADKVAAIYAQTIYSTLKTDVDTVAVHTDAGLRKTAQQLNQLTDYRSIQ